jgi:hypothetical protein
MSFTTYSSSSAVAGDGQVNVAMASALVVVVVIVAVLGGVLFRRYNKRKHTEEMTINYLSDTDANHPQATSKNEPVLNMGPLRDFDGNELEEVEIV